MMTKFAVIWFDGQSHSQYCDSKREASNLARKVSKEVPAKIYRCSGIWHNSSFFETESVYVVSYKDGKRNN